MKRTPRFQLSEGKGGTGIHRYGKCKSVSRYKRKDDKFHSRNAY